MKSLKSLLILFCWLLFWTSRGLGQQTVSNSSQTGQAQADVAPSGHTPNSDVRQPDLATARNTQSSRGSASQLIWILNQGEKLRLSQDFKVRLDGRKLRVALVNRRVISSDVSEELVVTLIQPQRKPQQVTVSADQPIEFEGVETGISSLLVMGVDKATKARSVTYAAFAFFAEPPRGEEVNPAVAPVPQTLDVPVALVGTQQLLGELPEVSTSANVQDVSQLSNYEEVPRNHFRVMRSPNGSVVGRFHVPEEPFAGSPGKIRITLFRNDAVVAETVSTPDGRFELPNLELGFYSVLASGPSGHAAYSFELIDRVQGAAKPNLEKPARTFVAIQLDAATQLDVLLIPPSLMGQVKELVTAAFGNAQVAGGVGPGAAGLAAAAAAANANNSSNSQNSSGGGGGGGGSSGGGGAAGLAALAGIAVGVSAFSNNDDGFNANVSSPIAPNRQ